MQESKGANNYPWYYIGLRTYNCFSIVPDCFTICIFNHLSSSVGQNIQGKTDLKLANVEVSPRHQKQSKIYI